MYLVFLYKGNREQKEGVSKEKIIYETLEQIQNRISNRETFFLYFGRESCPHCVIFLKKLELLNEKHTIYYLDSITDYANSKVEMKNFRDIYNFKTVPQFVYFKEGVRHKQLDIFDEMKLSDILSFIQRQENSRE